MGFRCKAFSGTPTGAPSPSLGPRRSTLWVTARQHQRLRRDCGNLRFVYSSAFYPVTRGVFTNIPVPDDGSIEATAINGSGSVVGYSGVHRLCGTPGWLLGRDRGSRIAGLRKPNHSRRHQCSGLRSRAGSPTTTSSTTACQSNNTGGFVMSPDGNLTLFQPPGTMPELLSHLPDTRDHMAALDQHRPGWGHHGFLHRHR